MYFLFAILLLLQKLTDVWFLKKFYLNVAIFFESFIKICFDFAACKFVIYSGT